MKRDFDFIQKIKRGMLLLPLMAVLLSAGNAWGQVTIFQDDFESGLGNWTVTADDEDYMWTTGNGIEHPFFSNPGAYSGNSNAVVSCDDDLNTSTYLQINFNFGNFTNKKISFRYMLPMWDPDIDELVVEISEDGEDWTEKATYNSDRPGWVAVSDLGLGSAAIKYVRFRATSAYGYGVAIDDVVVKGTPATTVNHPSKIANSYSFSQQIYLPSDVATGPCAISSISFFNSGTEVTRNYDIYMQHTNKDIFTGNSDLVPTAYEPLFSGSVTMAAGGWTTITFDHPFEYNGLDNLLLTVDDNTGSAASGMTCAVWSVTGKRSIYSASNTEDYNPRAATYSASKALAAKVNAVRFGTEPLEPAVALPSNCYYSYSYSQQIFFPSEVSGGVPCTIDSIGFHNLGEEKSRE